MDANLLQQLKDDLSIRIETRNFHDFGSCGITITVGLYVGEEKISEDSIMIYDKT